MIARPSLKSFLLWSPALILAIASLVVVLLLTTNNSKRISDLEQANSPAVITFTFNQQGANFRIVCREDHTNNNVYVCTTIRVGGPRPTPSPSKSGG